MILEILFVVFFVLTCIGGSGSIYYPDSKPARHATLIMLLILIGILGLAFWGGGSLRR